MRDARAQRGWGVSDPFFALAFLLFAGSSCFLVAVRAPPRTRSGCPRVPPDVGSGEATTIGRGRTKQITIRKDVSADSFERPRLAARDRATMWSDGASLCFGVWSGHFHFEFLGEAVLPAPGPTRDTPEQHESLGKCSAPPLPGLYSDRLNAGRGSRDGRIVFTTDRLAL